MATETPVTVVEGPNGKAEVFEVKKPDGQTAYELRFQGKKELYMAIGEAYVEAGAKAGVKT
jgi:hypothetical protein